MHPKSINKKTRAVLEKIAKSGIKGLRAFYLAGGTALAIQLGHRESIDLDWFSKEDFSLALLKRHIFDIGKFGLTDEADGTLNGDLDNVKISFLRYDYKLLFPKLEFNGVKLADERDIAAMKISAISSRGSKKDFIDLYFLLQKYSLKELFDFFERKFKGIKYNKLHIIKSLAYFEDAEDEPMPIMLKQVSWEKVKGKIKKELINFSLK